MKIKRILRESIVSIVIISIFWVSYAALSWLTATDSETLTAAKWNNLVEHAVPSNAVMAFYDTVCPVGWSKANWSEHTLDLRWEFIRGLDDWRGIDSWRTLWSYQAWTKITWEVGSAASANGHTIHDINNVYWDPVYESSFDSTIQYLSSVHPTASSTSWWKTVRPRNKALLYCIKN